MTRALAIYGGSFDPPHVGHVLACAYVLSAHRIDTVVLVPTARHPFDKQLTPFGHRVHMCELAVRDLRRVEVSPIEGELGGQSLTLRLVEELQRRNPDAALRLVIGSDLLPETPSWHKFSEIVALAPLIVVQRAGYVTAPEQPALPDVSSTELRRRLHAGESTEGLLDPVVAAYAQQHGLYK